MHENEILVFLLASMVLIFLELFRKPLQTLPSVSWLYSSFLAAWVAWLATNLEHLFWTNFFNILEHLAYALNGLLLCVWCWMVKRKGTEHAHD